MSRTRKDERARKNDAITLEVVRNDDGTYQVFSRGKLVLRRVEEPWLYEELCIRFGFCGDEYDPIKQQLDECGRWIRRF